MIGLLAILLLVLLVYGQSLWFPFHFDDYSLFSDPLVNDSDGWRGLFGLERTRPLTYLTFWLNDRLGGRLGGAGPWGYHGVNVLLHAGASAAAWSVTRRLLETPAAWAAAAVFALHPLQTEAVAYVFARSTVLAGLFCLLSWGDWLAQRPWRACAWFLAALLAKEEVVAFPLLLALTAGPPRRVWRPLAVMVATSAAAGLRLLYAAAHTPGSGVGGDRLAYASAQPGVVLSYLQLFVCPIGQNFDHDVKVSLVSALALATLGGLLLWKRRPLAIWVLGCLLLLAPTSSVFPLADRMFEHRMYLPLFCLAVAVGPALARLPRAALAALLIALSVTSFARTRLWASEEALWSDAAAKSPQKVRPKLQLARAIATTDPQRAAGWLEQARRLDPSHPETYTQLGILRLNQNQPQAALGSFEQALRLRPKSAEMLSNRGTALYLLGRSAEAEADFLRALEIDPCHPNARHNLRLLRPDSPPPLEACQSRPAVGQ